MTLTSEDGEILEFIDSNKSYLRGYLNDDGLGRQDIDGEIISSLVPEEVEPFEWCNMEEEEAQEYVFWVDVAVYKPTGEYKE